MGKIEWFFFRSLVLDFCIAMETISTRPRLIPSTRFLLALLLCFGFAIQFAQRTNLSIAIVCMVEKSGVGNRSENLPRSSFVFEERRFLWNEWDQQIIFGSYWGGYLLTLVPSKYERKIRIRIIVCD